MKKRDVFFVCFIFIIFSCIILVSPFVFAEDTFQTAGIVTKLTADEMKDAPEFNMVGVYPPWGVPCTNFTYYVSYKDRKGRHPAYVRIWLNGVWHDMQQISGNYNTGATYAYSVIPHSGAQLFYYFEASNGVGKARTGIIDSPNQGPVLFAEKLDNNQIILLDKNGKKLWAFDTGKDWVEGVSISKDGKYVAAVTNYFLYIFSKDSNIPLWKFCTGCAVPEFVAGDFQGVAISADGRYIALGFRGNVYLFSKDSNKPLWTKNIDLNTIGAAISDSGDTIAFGTGDTLFVFDKIGNEIIKYTASTPGYSIGSNFYRPAVTPDGNYIAVSTGCPDRRAYMFSNKGDLQFRTDTLTYDSPVHKSAISDDGSLVAYSADHIVGKEILFLFGNDGNKKWSFSSSDDSTARAVSISGDGNYVAIGTSAGHVYLFSKSGNTPLWKFTASGTFSQFGDVKLNSDGSLLAAVSSNKNIYLFSRNSNIPLWAYNANTWVTKADFNGEYVVAGTGAREFMFEGSSLTAAEVQCSEIIQPPDLSLLGWGIEGITAKQTQSPAGTKTSDGKCGNAICEPDFGETFANCSDDCSGDGKGTGSSKKGKSVEKPGGIVRNSVCGDKVCEGAEVETCYKDCGMKPDKTGKAFEQIESTPSEKDAQTAFAKIIEFFKRLFSKQE